jgi:putative hydrolase of the HAD superfamily
VTVTTLLLDAGGVLVHPNWERVSAALARHGVTAPAAELARVEPGVRHALDVPRRVASTTDATRAASYLDLVLAGVGIEPSDAVRDARAEIDAYHARHNLWERILPGVPTALDRLRAAGLRMVVVSNSNGTLAGLLARIGLAPYFVDVLDSAIEGVEKPDPEIFRRAVARAGARPETALHAGDLYEVDVAGARRAGIAAILIDGAGLYGEIDCPRVGSLGELADRLLGPGRS